MLIRLKNSRACAPPGSLPENTDYTQYGWHGHRREEPAPPGTIQLGEENVDPTVFAAPKRLKDGVTFDPTEARQDAVAPLGAASVERRHNAVFLLSCSGTLGRLATPQSSKRQQFCLDSRKL
jgi:hypothetical protein